MGVLSKTLFAERMRECLAYSGWTREEVADRLGVSVPTVGRWLSKGSSFQFPTLTQLVEFCDALGVSQTYITVGTGGIAALGDGPQRAVYRRYVEDPTFSQLVLLLMELPPEALLPLTEALAVVAHSQPAQSTAD